jgi:hypothetical protein
MNAVNESALPNVEKQAVKVLKRTKMRERQSFDMLETTSWEDERQARKFIRPSFDDIRQRMHDDGIKTRFKKSLDPLTLVQSYTIWCGREVETEDRNGAKKIEIRYSDWDYLAIHIDSSRRFSKLPTNRPDDENKDKKKKGKRHRKMHLKAEDKSNA